MTSGQRPVLLHLEGFRPLAYRFLLRLLGGLLWLAVPTATYAQTAQTQVLVVPAAAEVAINQTVDLAVNVQDVSNLYGLDITVRFDPTVVEVVDAHPGVTGTQIGQGTFLEPGFVLINTADNQAGTARFAMTQVNPSEAKNGSGTLIVLTLRGRQANATSLITLADVQLAAREGTPIQATLVSGQVQVTALPAAGPTNTLVPTVGSGTVFPGSVPDVTAGPTITSAPETSNPTSAAAAASQPASEATLSRIQETGAAATAASGGATQSVGELQGTDAAPATGTALAVEAEASGLPPTTATARALAFLPTRTESQATAFPTSTDAPRAGAGEQTSEAPVSPALLLAPLGLLVLAGIGVMAFMRRRRG